MAIIDHGCGGSRPGLEGALPGTIGRAAALNGSVTIHSPKGPGGHLSLRLPFRHENIDGAA